MTPFAAHAADIQVETPEIVQSAIGYRLGVALAGVHNTDGGMGVESNVGAQASETRLGGFIDVAVGYDFAPGWGVQGDALGAIFSDPDNGDDDWTESYGHAAVHLYHRTDAFLIGAFGGYGAHEDTGDSDESASYWFVGAEGKMYTGWGSAFGQAGYLDSEDQYEEGTQNAPFARIGANYFFNDNLALKLDASFALGDKYGDSDSNNRILDFGIEGEYRPESTPVSLFGRYDFTQISYKYDDSTTRYGDNFHSFMVGLRFRSGETLRQADRNPGSLDLPSFGKWVAYNANEIE